MISNLICIIFGLSSGLIAAGGVFALLTVIGVITRMTAKTKTTTWITTYEWTIIIGGALGNIATIYRIPLPLGYLGAGMFGFFSGIFTGCLAMALSESLDCTVIFSRRVKLKLGFPFIILAVALGKVTGSLLYYYLGL